MSISIGAERSCSIVSVNAGLSHQHTSFIVVDGAISGRVIVKVDRQAVVRVFIASYTQLPTTDMDRFTRSVTSCFSTLSRRHITISRPSSSMGTECYPSDRECASPPSGSNNSPVCFDAHIALPNSRSSILYYIPFPHISSPFPNVLPLVTALGFDSA